MYCPKCEGEFRSEIEVCPDCGVGLVSELQHTRTEAAMPGNGGSEFVPVLEISDASVLPVIKSVLTASGIPFVVQGDQAVGIDPPGRIAETVGFLALCAVVLVPAERKDEAQRLLESRGDYGSL